MEERGGALEPYDNPAAVDDFETWLALRARPGAPVALPLAWSELSKLKRADAFTIHEVPALLRRRRKHPWADIDRITQDLSRWSDVE